jgi:Macrocin-O-methyltransferase (TylF)
MMINKITWLIAKFVQKIIRLSDNRNDVFNVAKRRAVDSSADFYANVMLPHGALRFRDRYPLLDLAIKRCLTEGSILEFGSYKGKSLRYMGARTSRKIHGFDSFEGLQEDWAGSSPKGTFDVGGHLPKVPSNVRLHKGWFEATLPAFMAEDTDKVAFLHIDCDTYESSKYVLDQLSDRIQIGTIIQFDEYFGYPGWERGEHLAFSEWAAANNATYRYLGFGYMSVAVTIETRTP